MIRTANTASTREHILQTSLALFLKKGYSSTGMSELVRTAGVSKGAFYHYYSSKQELYEDALNTFFSSFIENQEYEMIPSKPFREGVRELYTIVPRLVEEMIHLTGEKEAAPNYYKILVDFYTRNPTFRETYQTYFQKSREYLMRLINKAKQNRQVDFEPDAEVLATQILCLIEGVGLVTSLHHPSEIGSYYDKIFTQFFRIVEP